MFLNTIADILDRIKYMYKRRYIRNLRKYGGRIGEKYWCRNTANCHERNKNISSNGNRSWYRDTYIERKHRTRTSSLG